ncbi:tetratricopeptide repeat protein [Prevotella sp. OH937_COT-195]|uniref:tetratricopeptide repeat protein n=1 Tax=Prevotella sp. OH937_COT-195 TaxID=2491051 RepID=UPI000F64D3FC|nr:hypothetical protein [Prevotella sp. OH937_COT-195]RRD03042.1 hypothetical protein EII32_00895 [Prevotella sp. OH937_COT-195]
MVRKYIYYACLIMVVFIPASCSDSHDAAVLDLEHYEPVDKFVPAYEALTNRTDIATNKDYDIEQTVKVINALELAQANSENFNDFLMQMARLDYTGVAPDVMEAKQKLLPILQYMYKLQAMDEQLSDMWMLVRSAAAGGKTAIKDKNIAQVAFAATGDPIAIFSIVSSEDADHATSSAFDQYEKDKKLKDEIRSDIERLRTSYMQYLTDYAPIYHKYMKEYDLMCVEKDRAYMDIYSGQPTSALAHSQKILDKYPGNGEAMLLKSFSLIMGGNGSSATGAINGIRQSVQAKDSIITSRGEVMLQDTMTVHRQTMNDAQWEADVIIDDYMLRYPDSTAPAMVLKGMLCQQTGNVNQAMLYFDQAAIEYPRQAARLTDMLESYRLRNYLGKTSEGQYLTRLYRSQMEGYGLFSPNLLKAKCHADKRDLSQCKEEIFKHFFRRGNQGVYDGLLSDMQFCEEHLYAGFKQLLIESSFIDVEVEPETKWLFWEDDELLNVKIKNRSDLDLENVRVFLCIHYTDMYKDEYDVVRVPKTMSIIGKHSTADFDTVRLSCAGKKTGDITRIRAIAITDDKICWVDETGYKKKHAISISGNGVDRRIEKDKEEYLKNYSIEPRKLKQTMLGGITVLQPEDDPKEEKGFWATIGSWFCRPDNDLKIELPRVLTMIDPVFSLRSADNDDVLMPTSNYLSGTSIHLVFDYVPKYNEQLPLYIYSDFVDFRINIIYRGKDSVISSVEEV